MSIVTEAFIMGAEEIERLRIENKKLKGLIESAAEVAETCYDFGPSTQCPDCGSSGQVLHWYTLGRKDAAKAIRKLKES